MENPTIEQILDLNRHFYESYAHEFSLTRQSFWDGWDHLVKYFDNNQKVRVLDIGCGNGRFLKFLVKRKMDFVYKGIDQSEQLVAQAIIDFAEEVKKGRASFVAADILTYEAQKETADFIGCFGLMHHIPSPKLRADVMNTLFTALKPNGIGAVTFWIKPPQRTQIIEQLPELGPNDYIRFWDKNPNMKRYIHVYEQDEACALMARGRIIEQFLADGKDHNANLYIVAQKM